MKKKLTFCLLLMGAATFLKAQTPFNSNLGVIIAKPGTNNAAKNYTIYTNSDMSQSQYSAGATINANLDINGIGYNLIDNYVYGAAMENLGYTNPTYAVRISADGEVTRLGMLPTPKLENIEMALLNSGTMSTSDKFYYLSVSVKPSGQSKILASVLGNVPLTLTPDDVFVSLCWVSNVSSLSENPSNSIPLDGSITLDYSDPEVYDIFKRYIDDINANFPNVQAADGGIQDLAISPQDSKIYSYASYLDDDNKIVGRLLRVDASNGKIITVGSEINEQPGKEMSGLAFDKDNNFYAIFSNGYYGKIDLTSGELTDLSMSNVAMANGNLRGDFTSAFSNIPFPNQTISLKARLVRSQEVVLEYRLEGQKIQEISSLSIEHSENGEAWTTIHQVTSNNEIALLTNDANYQFIDNHSVKSRNNFYRIQVKKRDNSVQLSKVERITIHIKDIITPYPNPITGELITFKGVTQKLEVSLTDINGRVLLSTSIDQSNNAIDVSNLQAGAYIVTIASGDVVLGQQKLVKVK